MLRHATLPLWKTTASTVEGGAALAEAKWQAILAGTPNAVARASLIVNGRPFPSKQRLLSQRIRAGSSPGDDASPYAPPRNRADGNEVSTKPERSVKAANTLFLLDNPAYARPSGAQVTSGTGSCSTKSSGNFSSSATPGAH
jgi:hypothetical protein